MTRRRASLASVGLAAALLGASCTGKIDAPGGTPDSNGSGAHTGGAGNGSGSGGAGNASLSGAGGSGNGSQPGTGATIGGSDTGGATAGARAARPPPTRTRRARYRSVG